MPTRLAVLDMNTGIPTRQRSNLDTRKDRPLFHLPGWLPHRALCYDVEIPMSADLSDVYLDQLPRLRMEVDEAVKEFESKYFIAIFPFFTCLLEWIKEDITKI